MTELEKLLDEKKKIESRIRELKSTDVIVNDIKFKVESHAYGRTDWKLLIKARHYSDRTYYKDSWKTVIEGSDRITVINSIPKLITDLQSIYDTLDKKNDCGE